MTAADGDWIWAGFIVQGHRKHDGFKIKKMQRVFQLRKKSFISRIENGHSDIQLSTLYRLVEIGFGKRVNLTIE